MPSRFRTSSRPIESTYCLVTARPYQGDVQYRSISGALVDLIQKERLPACVHVLRPPTFDRLTEHLRERPHFYHLIHFDGYGSLSTGAQDSALGFTIPGGQGQLIFENDEGKPRAIKAKHFKYAHARAFDSVHGA